MEIFRKFHGIFFHKFHGFYFFSSPPKSFKDDVDLKQDLRCDTIDTREEYELKVKIEKFYLFILIFFLPERAENNNKKNSTKKKKIGWEIHPKNE